MHLTPLTAALAALCLPAIVFAQHTGTAAPPALSRDPALTLPVVPVTVTNTPLAVTAQGTTQVAGAVSLVGTPTVNVANFPSASAAGAAPLAPTKPSDLVTLRSNGAKCGSTPWVAFNQRVNGDGTVSAYSIPAGKVLIVTSIDWRQGLTREPGQGDEFFLFPSSANIEVNIPIVDSVATTPGSFTGMSIVVSGVALKAGNPCWGVNALDHQGSADALLHGFLADDR